MVRRFHRSIYDELDELKASMDYLFQLALEPMDNPMLPQDEGPGIVCLYPHNLNVEVSEDSEDVIVTVDIVPGIEPSKISIDLSDRSTLNITCNRRDEMDKEGRQEPRSVSLHQEIALPCPVIRNGARSTLKHGVLDLRLKKVRHARS
jgi:HSP20 family protein